MYINYKLNLEGDAINKIHNGKEGMEEESYNV